MAFHDVTLPEGFSYGSVAGAGFATIIRATATGHEWRVARQSQGQHRLSLRAINWTKAEAKAIKAFGLARRGSLHSFKVKDFSDFTSNADGETAPTNLDQEIGTGDGVEDTFQLVKVYAEGLDGEYVRTITLPDADTIVVSIDGADNESWTLSGDGRITFASPPANGAVVKAGFEFFIPVRFVADFDKWARLQADAFELWSLPLLDVVEVLDEVEQPERWDGGGGRNWGEVTQSIEIAWNDGCLQSVMPSTAISAFLPVPETARTGSEVFVVSCAVGSAGSVQVRDDLGNALGSTLSAGDVLRISFVRTSSTQGSWLAA
jgi:uncharacterized protein (TIGR02217 family)